MVRKGKAQPEIERTWFFDHGRFVLKLEMDRNNIGTMSAFFTMKSGKVKKISVRGAVELGEAE